MCIATLLEQKFIIFLVTYGLLISSNKESPDRTALHGQRTGSHSKYKRNLSKPDNNTILGDEVTW